MEVQTPSYLFESRPAAVAAGRRKFREPRRPTVHDPRIVRGNTYAPGNLFVDRANASVTQAQEKAEMMRRKQAAARQREAEARARELAAEPQMPPGRVSIPLQTDAYLDELEDQSFHADAAAQTDPDNAPRKVPKFKKKKMGISVGTSILPGELFDFDMSIDPILEVLVGKCVDQGSVEVLQEQELKLLNATEKEFNRRTEAAEAESKRLMDNTEQLYQEKEKILQQYRARHQAQHTMALKLTSRAMSKRYLAGLENTVLGQLEAACVLPEPASSQVQTVFLPWLFGEVNKRLGLVRHSRALLDQVLVRSIEEAHLEVKTHKEHEIREQQELAAEVQARADERQRILQQIAGIMARRLEKEQETARSLASATDDVTQDDTSAPGDDNDDSNDSS